MKIGIFGSGIVGSAVGRGYAKMNNEVLFYDVSGNVLSSLASEGYKTTGSSREIVMDSGILFICVPTPSKNGGIDLSFMKDASKEIGRRLRHKKKYTTIVVKSTVTPSTTESVVIPLIQNHSGKKAGKDFGVCMNPEFLRQNHALADFLNPDRIVIGQYDLKSGNALARLCSKFKCPVFRTDLKTAEIAKYANNTFYAAKISFFNEMHLVCKRIGVDSGMVREIVKSDRFYATHPWNHGSPFVGKCLPKDLDAFISFFESEAGRKPELLLAVKKVNRQISGAMKG